MTEPRKPRKRPIIQSGDRTEWARIQLARSLAYAEQLKTQAPWDPTAVEREPVPAWRKHYRKDR